MSFSDQFGTKEFDDFLRGEGELARELKALQFTPPAQLDEAILARAARQLQAQQRLSAANDAFHGANHDVIQGAPDGTISTAIDATTAGRPAPFLHRWRIPLGLAASLMLCVPVALRLQSENNAATAIVTTTVPEIKPSAPAPPEPVVELPKLAAAAPSVPSFARSAKQTPPTVPAQSERKIADNKPEKASAKSVARGDVVAQAERYANTAPALSPVPTASRVARTATSYTTFDASRNMASVAEAPAPIVAGAPPATAREATAKAPIKSEQLAKAWLDVIGEMLKAGLRTDAQEEWQNFRKEYPDYPVGEELYSRIKASTK